MNSKLFLFYLLLSTANANGMDTLSFTHALGSSGNQGIETLQLICVKDDCHLSKSLNEKMRLEKKLQRPEVKSFFDRALVALKEKNALGGESSSTRVNLEYLNQNLTTKADTLTLRRLEMNLRAKLRP